MACVQASDRTMAEQGLQQTSRDKNKTILNGGGGDDNKRSAYGSEGVYVVAI